MLTPKILEANLIKLLLISFHRSGGSGGGRSLGSLKSNHLTQSRGGSNGVAHVAIPRAAVASAFRTNARVSTTVEVA